MYGNEQTLPELLCDQTTWMIKTTKNIYALQGEGIFAVVAQKYNFERPLKWFNIFRITITSLLNRLTQLIHYTMLSFSFTDVLLVVIIYQL